MKAATLLVTFMVAVSTLFLAVCILKTGGAYEHREREIKKQVDVTYNALTIQSNDIVDKYNYIHERHESTLNDLSEYSGHVHNIGYGKLKTSSPVESSF